MDNTWQRIYESALKFLVPLRAKENYIVIAKEAIKLVGGGYASIFLFQENRLKRIYTTFEELKTIEPRKEGSTYEVFRTRMPILRQKENLIDANRKFKTLPIQSNIIVPLDYGHISIGALSVLSKEGVEFGDKELEIITLFAPLATLAIRKVQLLEETEQAVKARDLFISLAEHEIKNPLTSILLNLELLKKSKKEEEEEETKYIDKLDTTVRKLTNLVSDFLQAESTIENLKYKFSLVDIVFLCKQSTQDLSQQNTTHKFAFENKTGNERIIVRCDENKIYQVLTNLVNNSVKFSAPNSKIKIVVELKNDWVKISVIDKGIGVPKKELPNVFKRYYLGSKREKGMGLGLYLAKKIVEKNKGNIKIDSIVDKGTTVTFELPIYKVNDRKTRTSKRT